MDFQDRSTTKKGSYAQQIVREWFIERGHFPTPEYDPRENRPHMVDMFCVRKDGTVIAVDAKGKAARAKFDDTGIDYRHFHDYMNIAMANKMDVWAIFLDHIEGYAYGAPILELARPYHKAPQSEAGRKRGCFPKPGSYPRIEADIIYFPRAAMATLFELSDVQRNTLATMTHTNVGVPDLFKAA